MHGGCPIHKGCAKTLTSVYLRTFRYTFTVRRHFAAKGMKPSRVSFLRPHPLPSQGPGPRSNDRGPGTVSDGLHSSALSSWHVCSAPPVSTPTALSLPCKRAAPPGLLLRPHSRRAGLMVTKPWNRFTRPAILHCHPTLEWFFLCRITSLVGFTPRAAVVCPRLPPWHSFRKICGLTISGDRTRKRPLIPRQ